MRELPYTYPPTKIKVTLMNRIFLGSRAWTVRQYFVMLLHLWRMYAEYAK